ncbi:hypothetical protein [Myroides odoratus]|uniref:hypothetical protein n=1 Tax=Myroides odoratus TaxID=256 RepID=UPI00333FC006
MTKNKKEEGSIWFMVVFLVGIAVLLYFNVYKKDIVFYLNKGYSGMITKELSGVIKEKKIDNSDHNNSILIFTNQTEIKGINGYFWGKLQVGDSISKVKGDSVIQVFRNGEKIVLEIAPFYERAIENEKNKKSNSFF